VDDLRTDLVFELHSTFADQRTTEHQLLWIGVAAISTISIDHDMTETDCQRTEEITVTTRHGKTQSEQRHKPLSGVG